MIAILSGLAAPTLAVGTLAGLLSQQVSGRVPASIGPASRILWIGSDEDQTVACVLTSERLWSCQITSLKHDSIGSPEHTSAVFPGSAVGLGGITSPMSVVGPRGIVVFIADASIAYVPIGASNDVGDHALWGRVIRVRPRGVAPEDLHALRVTAWKPQRSVLRAQARRFVAVRDDSVRVVPLSSTAFWIAGQTVESGAFLLIEGPAIATSRLATDALATDSPEVPLIAPADAPQSLTGRLQTRDGRDVDDAEVELFDPLRISDAPDGPDHHRPTELVRRANVRSSADGTFAFDRLSSGVYEISVIHPRFGRGEVTVKSLSQPVLIRLIPPTRAVGRVLRRGLPVGGARIRFIPDAGAFMASADPLLHIAEETISEADGTFVLPLPPASAGFVQLVGTDGVMKRISISPGSGTQDILLGDVVLADPRRLIVRLVEPAACSLFATGPLGMLGLAVIRASDPYGTFSTFPFELPEPGEWALSADCGGQVRPVEPNIVNVPPEGPESLIDVRVIRPR
jgi:hypothetical protein